MNRTKKNRIALISVLSLAAGLFALTADASPLAHPAANPIRMVNNGIGFGYAGQQSNYSENTPSPADVENGWINGLVINSSGNFSIAGIHNLYAASSYTHVGGNVTYREGKASEAAGHNVNEVQAKVGKTGGFKFEAQHRRLTL